MRKKRGIRLRIRPSHIGDRIVSYSLILEVDGKLKAMLFYRNRREQVVRLAKIMQDALNTQPWETEKKEVY